jgi:hypothetical protein
LTIITTALFVSSLVGIIRIIEQPIDHVCCIMSTADVWNFTSNHIETHSHHASRPSNLEEEPFRSVYRSTARIEYENLAIFQRLYGPLGLYFNRCWQQCIVNVLEMRTTSTSSL